MYADTHGRGHTYVPFILILAPLTPVGKAPGRAPLKRFSLNLPFDVVEEQSVLLLALTRAARFQQRRQLIAE